MASIVRIILITGLLTVLMPCACDEFSRWTGVACHESENGCCGGADLHLHASMDQKAVPGPSVQVLPPVVMARADLFKSSEVATGPVLPDVVLRSKSPPGYSPPLRI